MLASSCACILAPQHTAAPQLLLFSIKVRGASGGEYIGNFTVARERRPDRPRPVSCVRSCVARCLCFVF